MVLGWPAGLNTSFIYGGLVLLQNLNDTEQIICSKRSFTGSQLICLNSFRPVFALLFKFRQNRIHLCWSWNISLHRIGKCCLMIVMSCYVLWLTKKELGAGVIYSWDYYQEFSHTQTLPTSSSLTERQPISLEWERGVVPVTHSARMVVINFF